ncbi:MAG TPA: hypothetical protein VLH18_01145, partial [Candidatus Limnocylindrales bacterium]|nr:hypothetical protein [Candidatus Limnocylindrales bacterium]
MDSFWKRLTVFNSNGCRLAALFLEAAEDGRVAGGGALGGESGRQGERSPIVVACHGFTGTKEGGGRALAMGESL